MPDPNTYPSGEWHQRELEDSERNRWIARQRLGIGVQTAAMPLTSHVEFYNPETGDLLHGRAQGLGAADDQELLAALAEAQRLKRLDDQQLS